MVPLGEACGVGKKERRTDARKPDRQSPRTKSHTLGADLLIHTLTGSSAARAHGKAMTEEGEIRMKDHTDDSRKTLKQLTDQKDVLKRGAVVMRRATEIGSDVKGEEATRHPLEP